MSTDSKSISGDQPLGVTEQEQSGDSCGLTECKMKFHCWRGGIRLKPYDYEKKRPFHCCKNLVELDLDCRNLPKPQELDEKTQELDEKTEILDEKTEDSYGKVQYIEDVILRMMELPLVERQLAMTTLGEIDLSSLGDCSLKYLSIGNCHYVTCFPEKLSVISLHLSCMNQEITEQILISAAENVQNLVITKCNFDPTILKKMPNLQTLIIDQTRRASELCYVIGGMPSLKELTLRGKNITDFIPLISHPKLEYLDVRGTGFQYQEFKQTVESYEEATEDPDPFFERVTLIYNDPTADPMTNPQTL